MCAFHILRRFLHGSECGTLVTPTARRAVLLPWHYPHRPPVIRPAVRFVIDADADPLRRANLLRRLAVAPAVRGVVHGEAAVVAVVARPLRDRGERYIAAHACRCRPITDTPAERGTIDPNRTALRAAGVNGLK